MTSAASLQRLVSDRAEMLRPEHRSHDGAPGVRDSGLASPAVPDFYMHPGQLSASRGAATISTILGSCVSMCVFDPQERVGGANHFLLPLSTDPDDKSPRYAAPALSQLVDQLWLLGARPGHLQAKIFGGACVLANYQDDAVQLGARNVQVARELLRTARIPVLVEDVGGRRGRKVIFRAGDGHAWVKLL